MPLRPHLFRKVTIVGVGLIGGSVGLAIKKRRLAREVVGLSQHHSSLTAALKCQAIDHGYHDVKKAVSNADLVVLATPVSIIKGMFSIIGSSLKRNCIVTDVGSTKQTIIQSAERHLPHHVHFVGSHPLAGSEKRGVQNAHADLFENSVCIVTLTDKTNRSAAERVKRLWMKLGASVKNLNPQDHDKILAYTSHIPHLLAYALMDVIPSSSLEYAGQGLKDSTRIAGSSPQMWSDICLGNSRNIIQGMDEIVRNLSSLRKMLSVSDHKGLMHQLQKGKKKRDDLI